MISRIDFGIKLHFLKRMTHRNRMSHSHMTHNVSYRSMTRLEACRLLEIDPNEQIDQKKLKNIYFQKAKLFHPDTKTENDSKSNRDFENIKNAFDSLS